MSEEQRWMQRAIELGEKARIIAPPNPWVGCVIVKDGKAIGEGFTSAPGGAHAEINALSEAGEEAKGADAYITLEPCAHQGRTGPCSDALIRAGIKRVVIGVEDPDRNVSGKGIQQLSEAGIEILVGVLSNEVYASLEPYMHQRKTGRPFCVAKSAISIDGRTAAADRTSQWISSIEARRDAHLLRAHSQAILIGAGTALTDNPQLTVRHVDYPLEKQPLRVLLDTHGRVSTFSPLFNTSLAPTLVFTSSECKEEIRHSWKEAGAEVIQVPKSSSGIGLDLQSILETLSQRGIVQLLVEGGATLFGTMLKQGFMDRLVIYMGSCILGDRGQPLFKDVGIETMKESIPMHLIKCEQIGASARLEYRVSTE